MKYNAQSRDVQSDDLDKARHLFVLVIEQALIDARSKSQLPIDRLRRDKALQWFSSQEFKWWCDICAWDRRDYRFRALRQRVAKIEGQVDSLGRHIRAWRVGRTKEVDHARLR